MGQAVLSFPQFQDLEPDEAIKLFSDLVDLKIQSEWTSSEEWEKDGKRARQVDQVDQGINFVSMLLFFIFFVATMGQCFRKHSSETYCDIFFLNMLWH